LVFSTLDRTSEQENNLYDFLVSSNPSVEWLALIFRQVFLVPVLNLTCRFEHLRGSDVDGPLHISEGGLQSCFTAIEVNFNLEEGLQIALLLVADTTSANTFFHLVERELGGVQECLIH
jgi:hypothetical protein